MCAYIYLHISMFMCMVLRVYIVSSIVLGEKGVRRLSLNIW